MYVCMYVGGLKNLESEVSVLYVTLIVFLK